jgi:hypothetical protein
MSVEQLQITRYKCGTCGSVYDASESAELCDSKPVTQDRGVKVGDVVRITAGDGSGGLATVEQVYVLSRDWGHYAWERYWHTVALNAKLNRGYGHRMLTFDSYEVVA